MMMETIDYFIKNGTNPIMVALDMSMAFDKCVFIKLFDKIKVRIPLIVTRVLMFVYEKQFAWVRWGSSEKSSIFGIVNGTRQGAILSPALFSVYVQDLLDMLEDLGVGCYVGHQAGGACGVAGGGGTYLGAVAWADDILLCAPTRAAMQRMLDTAERFAKAHNLEFSTDPDPVKSKSKAIFMIGRNAGLQKPINLKLCGSDLPWVSHATHLGHEFSEDGTMDLDSRMRKAAYIGKSLEVRDSFSFAAPSEILAAIKLYAADLYGGMMMRLDGVMAKQVMNCWGVTVKDVFGVPRSTHSTLARWLSYGLSSLREDLLTRWVKFYQSLLTSSSPHLITIARIAASDVRTTTGSNNRLISDLTGLNPRTVTPRQVKEKLREQEWTDSEEENEKVSTLLELLQERGEVFYKGEEDPGLTTLVNYICTQ